jgi:hypothetical protein
MSKLFSLRASAYLADSSSYWELVPSRNSDVAQEIAAWLAELVGFAIKQLRQNNTIFVLAPKLSRHPLAVRLN